VLTLVGGIALCVVIYARGFAVVSNLSLTERIATTDDSPPTTMANRMMRRGNATGRKEHDPGTRA